MRTGGGAEGARVHEAMTGGRLGALPGETALTLELVPVLRCRSSQFKGETGREPPSTSWSTDSV